MSQLRNESMPSTVEVIAYIYILTCLYSCTDWMIISLYDNWKCFLGIWSMYICSNSVSVLISCVRDMFVCILAMHFYFGTPCVTFIIINDKNVPQPQGVLDFSPSMCKTCVPFQQSINRINPLRASCHFALYNCTTDWYMGFIFTKPNPKK